MSQTMIDDVVHEYTDDRDRTLYAVGKWNDHSGHYERPLDAEERRLTGCFAESGPLSYMPSFTTRQAAEVRARELFKV